MKGLVIGLKIISAVVFLILPYIFGLLPMWSIGRIKKNGNKENGKWMSIANCGTGGIFFAIGIVHLLREASSDLGDNLTDRVPVAELLFVIGFFVIFYLEHVLINHNHGHGLSDEKEQCGVLTHEADFASPAEAERMPILSGYGSVPINRNEKSDRGNLLSTILTLVLSVHSIIGGLTLGIHQDTKSVIEIMVAIMAHKWLESLALGISLSKEPDYIDYDEYQNSKREISEGIEGKKAEKEKAEKKEPFFNDRVIKIMVYSVMEPLGVVIGTVLGFWLNGPALYITSAVLTSLGAGTFIYIATMDILAIEFLNPKADRKGWKFIACMIGLIISSGFIIGFDWDQD